MPSLLALLGESQNSSSTKSLGMSILTFMLLFVRFFRLLLHLVYCLLEECF